MAIYNPPLENLPEFDTSVFVNEGGGLTIAEGDARYLRFPVSQGGETISGNLAVSGITTTNDVEPSSAITNMDIGATQSSGVLNIGTLAGRGGTINIGTGATSKTMNIGAYGYGTTTLSGFNTNIQGANINVGVVNTSGSVNIGRTDATATSLTINIGTGASQSGAINIGTGTTTAKNITIGTGSGGTTLLRGANVELQSNNSGANLLFSSATGGSLTVGGTTTGSQVLNINRPFTPLYLPSAITANTQIGFTASTTDNTFTQAVAGVYNILSVSLPSGVWMVEGCFVFSGATGGGRKISLGTTTAVSETDRANGVATGSFASLQVATIFSFSTTTTVYLNIDITAALGGSGTNFTTLRHTRFA